MKEKTKDFLKCWWVLAAWIFAIGMTWTDKATVRLPDGTDAYDLMPFSHISCYQLSGLCLGIALCRSFGCYGREDSNFRLAMKNNALTLTNPYL